MARTNSKGRSIPRWVGLPHSMIDSPAFMSLSSNAISLFIHMQRRYNGFNNGDIAFSCREAMAKLGTSKDTANRTFHELIEKGFIQNTKASAFSVKTRQSRRWALTNWPLKQGVAPTQDWRFWTILNQNAVRVRGQVVRHKGQKGEQTQLNSNLQYDCRDKKEVSENVTVR